MTDNEFISSKDVSKSRKSLWYLDSGCFRHMTKDKGKFKSFKKKEQGYVTYGDNKNGIILGSGDIGSVETLKIQDVFLVEGTC